MNAREKGQGLILFLVILGLAAAGGAAGYGVITSQDTTIKTQAETNQVAVKANADLAQANQQTAKANADLAQANADQAQAVADVAQANAETVKAGADLIRAQAEYFRSQSMLFSAGVLAIVILLPLLTVLGAVAIWAIRKQATGPVYLPQQEQVSQLERGQSLIVWPDARREMVSNDRRQNVYKSV